LIAQNRCLKFNRSFEKRGPAMWANEQRQARPEKRPEHSVNRSLAVREVPFVSRFFRKFVLEVLPAALASLLGGFLFAQFHAGSSPASLPPAEQVTPASPEVMALVRDEHAAVVGYLKSQMAAEKKRFAAEDAETAHAVEVAAEEKAAEEKTAQAAQEQADQEQSAQDNNSATNNANNSAPEKAASALNSADAKQAPAHRSVASVVSKPLLPRAKPAVVIAASAPAPSAGGAPLVIAQADQTTQPDDSSGRLARDPDSLLAKTLDLKDQVVAATRHAVSAIGDVFTSVGEHITGTAPTTHQFSSDS
jgi:hypothetical protein